MTTATYQEIYQKLLEFFGPQHWWPAESSLEMIVGAVLTQNTNWTNVVKALDRLKKENLLNYTGLNTIDEPYLASLIQPAGYYNLKARRLKNLLAMLEQEYSGDVDLLVQDSLEGGRNNLLAVKGVGPETADSILLYACHKPVFVVDSYTHRVFTRHNLIAEESDYHEIQEQFMDHLPPDVQLFNEYHALIVRVGKEFCKKRNPLCKSCPLVDFL